MAALQEAVMPTVPEVSPSALSRPRSPSAASSSSGDASLTSDGSSWQQGVSGAVLDEQFLPRLVSIFFALFHPTEGPKVVYQVPEGSVVPEVEATPAAGGVVRPRPLFDFAGLSEYIIPKEPLCGRLVTCTARALQMPRAAGVSSAQTESEAPRSRRPSSVRPSRPPTPTREEKPTLEAASLSHPGAAASSSFKVLSHPVLISDEAKYARNTFIFNIGFVFDGKADVRAYEPVVRKCARQLRVLEEQSCFLSSPLSQTRMYAVLEQLYEDLNSYCESFVALPDAPHTKYLDTLAATGSGPVNALQAALGRARAGTRGSAGRSTGPTTPLQQSVQERAATHAQAQGAAERQAIAARRRSSGGGSAKSGSLMTRMTSMTEHAGVSPMAIPEHSVGPVPPLTLGESSVAMRRTPSGEGAAAALGEAAAPRKLSSGAVISPLSAGVTWTAEHIAPADSSAIASSSVSSSDEEDAGPYEPPSAEAAQLLASRSSSSASGASSTRPMLGRAKTLAAVGVTGSIVNTTSAATAAPTSPLAEVEALLPALSPPLMLRALSHEGGMAATGAGAAGIHAAKAAAVPPPSAAGVAASLARSGSGASRSSAMTDPPGSARRDGRSSGGSGSQGKEAMRESILALRTIGTPQPSIPALSAASSTTTLEARALQPLVSQSLGALAPAMMLAPGKREPPHGLGRTVRDAINLKLFPTYANPPPVYDWQVPVALLDLARHADGNWDLTMAKIFPFIDGVNHVKRIAQLADAGIDLTRQCMEHLLYYGCIIMIDIFQFFNMYTLRPLIATMAEDPSIERECAPYVTRPGHKLPAWPKLLLLYSLLRPGVTLHEWIEENDVDALGIDVRRFITFGVIKGFLRRVHRYPILLGPVAPQSTDDESGGNVAGTSTFSMSAGLGLHKSASGLPPREHSGSRERPTLNRSQDTARPLNHPNATDEESPFRRRRREPSETGSMITLVDATGTSPSKRPLGSRKRTTLHRHATATAIDVASYALDAGAAAASEARHEGDDTLGPPSARVSIRNSPLRSRPSQGSLPRGRGSASGAAAGASAFSRVAESDGKATSSVSIPAELPLLLDGTRPDDELCVHFGIPWSELHQLLAHIGRMSYEHGGASARARSGERDAAQATSEWAEDEMANASGFGHFGAMSGWGPVAGGKRGAPSGAAGATSGFSRVGARNRRRSSQHEAMPQSSAFSRRSSKAGAGAESSGTARGTSEWTRAGAQSSLAFESEEGMYGTASGPIGSAWAMLDDKEVSNAGDYGRVRIILQ